MIADRLRWQSRGAHCAEEGDESLTSGQRQRHRQRHSYMRQRQQRLQRIYSHGFKTVQEME